MTRTLKVRKPTLTEMQRLDELLEMSEAPQAQRRAQAILYHGLGMTGRAIAQALHVHFNTIYADLRAFAREGLTCVHALPVGGAPRRLTDKQLQAIWHWAECSPQEVGLLDARWTLTTFREFLVKHKHVLKKISLEHLRRILKKSRFAFGAWNANYLVWIRNGVRFWLGFVECFSTCRPMAF